MLLYIIVIALSTIATTIVIVKDGRVITAKKEIKKKRKEMIPKMKQRRLKAIEKSFGNVSISGNEQFILHF